MLKVSISDHLSVSKNGFFVGTITHGWADGNHCWRVLPCLIIDGLVIDFATQRQAFEYLIGEQYECVSNGI